MFGCLFYGGCTQEMESPIGHAPSNERSKEKQYFISTNKDSIPIGKTFTIQEKQLPKSAVTSWKSSPIKADKIKINATSNPALPPKEIPIIEIKKIIPGVVGIPLPDTLLVETTTTIARHPQPISAGLPRMKENATANIRSLGYAEGMNALNTPQLIEDSRGDIWIGNSHGISKYDGSQFLHYTSEEGFPSSGTVNVLKADRHGNIWMASSPAILTCFDGSQFTKFILKDPSDSTDCYTAMSYFAESENGDLWFRTAGGLIKYNGQQFIRYRYTLEPNERGARRAIASLNNTIWFTATDGIYSFDGDVFTQYSFIQEETSPLIPFSIFKNKKGHLWIAGGNNGAFRFEPRATPTKSKLYQYTPTEGLPNNGIAVITEDQYGGIWMGTHDYGAFHFDGKTFSIYSEAEGLSNNDVHGFLLDHANNLWIGTTRQGFNVHDLNSFSFLNIADLPTSDLGTRLGVSSKIGDGTGNLWFTFYDAYLYHIQNNQIIGYDFSSILDGMVMDFSVLTRFANLKLKHTANNGNIWLSTHTGTLIRFEADNNQGYATQFSIDSNYVKGLINHIIETPDGNLWISSEKGSLIRFDGKDFFHYSLDAIGNTEINQFFADSQGSIWIAFKEGGLARITKAPTDTQATLKILLGNETSNNIPIADISEDAHQQLWFSLGDSILQYKDNQFTAFSTKDKRTNGVITAAIADTDGNIWVTTERGFHVMKKSDSADSKEKALDKFQFYHFDHSNGLKHAFKSKALIDNNRIWWNEENELISLNLDKFTLPTAPPQLHLRTIDIDQTSINYELLADTTYRNSLANGALLVKAIDSIPPFFNYPAVLNLPYQLNHLTFHFSAIDWQAPHRLQYSYLLEGLDTQWSTLSKESKADYRNLLPGNYTFKVKAIGVAKKWSNTFDYSFTIHPPWWQTWWARLLYVLLGGLLIYALFRWRTFNLRAQQKQLEATVTQRTAEVVEQQKRSDELLLNILPAEVANELKATGQVQPVLFEEVSILFADFQEFTHIVASIPGKKLVQELDDIFQHFDDIMEEHGIEKIQTIGDAYVAACGLPKKTNDHANKCVLAAKQMIAYLDIRNQTSAIKWKIRIGIHSGTITAGVVGKRKFTYDLFGDTINIAARIESAGEEGKINVSAYTYDLIKEQFSGDYRGKINAKGKGNLDMYFVD